MHQASTISAISLSLITTRADFLHQLGFAVWAVDVPKPPVHEVDLHDVDDRPNEYLALLHRVKLWPGRGDERMVEVMADLEAEDLLYDYVNLAVLRCRGHSCSGDLHNVLRCRRQ